ncbi:MAG: hypothetical protein LC776_18330, partial [Acidobacteria bacterium]|nr:hypothetical protein [Acidobacteriota bacterium]
MTHEGLTLHACEKSPNQDADSSAKKKYIHASNNFITQVVDLKSKKRLKLIDLFAGAGGLTLGFTHVFGRHIEPVW